MEREVDRWRATDEWALAEDIHDAICHLDHQMDQCWGLNLPYDMEQPHLSRIQREYLMRAQELIRITGGIEQARRVLEPLSRDWMHEIEILG